MRVSTAKHKFSFFPRCLVNSAVFGVALIIREGVRRMLEYTGVQMQCLMFTDYPKSTNILMLHNITCMPDDMKKATMRRSI